MKKYQIEFKWALIFIVMMLLWMIMERAVGLHDTYIAQHAIYTNFVAIPAIIIFVLALRDKRKQVYNGKMSYKQGFMTGLVMTLIITAVSPLSQYIISTIITPNYFTNVIEYTVSTGKSTLEEAQNYFNLQSYMLQSAIGSLVMGIVTSAVVAIFTRGKAS